MEELFISILNMSLTASYVIIVIILIRLFLKKAPKVASYILWAAAGFRLIFPFSFESVLSLIPFRSHPIPYSAGLGESVSLGYSADAALRTIGDAANGGIGTVTVRLGRTMDGYPITTKAYHSQVWLNFGSYLWIIGVAALLIYSIVSVVLLKRRLCGAVHAGERIYHADNLKTPFVLGFFRPYIYIPTGLPKEEMSYIILHEQTHIKRFDHLVKMAAFLILCIHWFNPLVWMAFLLMSVDMEMSCDERVLREMGSGIKKAYSTSLLSLSLGRRLINGSPLAFGEGNIKGRIKNVLNFKKPAVWVIIVSVVLVAALSVGFAANRSDDGAGNGLSEGSGIEGSGGIGGSGGSGFPEGSGINMSGDNPVQSMGASGVIPSSPKLLPGQDVGVDMAELDYASEDIVIFHGYFGLFVYDLDSGKIVRSVDLKPVGCSATQGDDYCDVTVSADGKTVQLHPMSSKNMYIYSVVDNTLKETTHERMENRFADFVDIVEVVGFENAGACSHSAVRFGNGEYGYLHTSDWTLGTLTYVRGDMTYSLFDFNALSPDESATAADTLPQGGSVPAIEDMPQGGSVPAAVNDLEQSISNAIMSYYTRNSDIYGGWYEVAGEGHITFETEAKDGLTYAYIWEKFARLGFENGILTEISGHANPAVIVFERDSGGNYIFRQLKRTDDGSGHRESLEKIFSASAIKKWDSADANRLRAAADAQIEAYAKAYLKKIGREADIHISHIDKTLADMNVDVSNYLLDAYWDYPYWIGTKEVVENGTRYVYEKAWRDMGGQNGKVTFTKRIYGGDVVEKTVIEVKGSEMNCLEGILRKGKRY